MDEGTITMIANPAGLRHTARLLLAAGVAAGVLLAGAASAMADSAQLTITDTGGRPDPVADVARVFTVSGTAAVSEELFVSQRPAGGAACAPSPYTDPGQPIPGTGNSFYFRQVQGSFNVQAAATWGGPGSYLFCIWLTPNSTTVSTPISQVITFRSPTGTISATINPLIPRPSQDVNVTVTGASEASEDVFATVRSAGGAPCAPSFRSDPGESVINGTSVNGSFAIQATTNQSSAGNYVLCLWLAGSSSDPAPIAGPQAIPFSVVQPPPVVGSASVLNCANQRHVATVRARVVKSVCLRYRFSTLPLQGQKLTATFVNPAHRTYKRISTTWPDQTTPTITLGSLLSRGYNHRRGTWTVILRVAGKQVNSTSFRVV